MVIVRLDTDRWRAPPSARVRQSGRPSHQLHTYIIIRETSEIPVQTHDIPNNVCAMVTKHGVRRLLEMCPQRNLIGHGAGGDEEGSLFARYFGHVSLESLGAWLVVDVISDGRACGV